MARNTDSASNVQRPLPPLEPPLERGGVRDAEVHHPGNRRYSRLVPLVSLAQPSDQPIRKLPPLRGALHLYALVQAMNPMAEYSRLPARRSSRSAARSRVAPRPGRSSRGVDARAGPLLDGTRIGSGWQHFLGRTPSAFGCRMPENAPNRVSSTRFAISVLQWSRDATKAFACKTLQAPDSAQRRIVYPGLK